MTDVLVALKDTPLPTILVVGGLIFLLLATTSRVSGKIVVPASRQKSAGVIGVALLVSGVALYVTPTSQPPPATPIALVANTSTASPPTATALQVLPTEVPVTFILVNNSLDVWDFFMDEVHQTPIKSGNYLFFPVKRGKYRFHSCPLGKTPRANSQDCISTEEQIVSNSPHLYEIPCNPCADLPTSQKLIIVNIGHDVDVYESNSAFLTSVDNASFQVIPVTFGDLASFWICTRGYQPKDGLPHCDTLIKTSTVRRGPISYMYIY